MDIKEIPSYRCTKCNKVYIDKDIAEKCCTPGKCKVCGKELNYYYRTKCDSCIKNGRYEKAEKINFSDYKIECLFDSFYDEYYRDEEELFEAHELNEDENIPTWAWGCKEINFQVDIESAIESAEENMYDEFDDVVDIEELIEFVREWNERQIGRAYKPDYKTVVLLSKH